ncbi:MAG: DNA polymerase I [Gammaproteobacteria bacterium]|nr:DNA polymerase I [Gammaproteobacteria bacterium]
MVTKKIRETEPETEVPLLLVDGSSYLFRAYFALPELKTTDGTPTGAIRGVISMLRKLAKDFAGSPIAVVFDAPGKTFRDDLFAQYKANRPPMPNDLREQIQPIHDIIRAMGLPLLAVSGVEADDVIGTLATEATRTKRRTIISTGDKDMAQLVSDDVTLVNTMNDTTMDREGVVAKFGVVPELIIDYLALMGDSADNIPGVPKVGPKTAAKWLNEYGSLDEVIANAGLIKGKVGENLRATLDQLPLSRELTTIRCDVPLEVGIEDLETPPPDVGELKNLYTRFEFKTWMEEVEGSGEGAGETGKTTVAERNYHCVDNSADLAKWVRRLASAELIALDTKTTSNDYMNAELVGFSFCAKPGEAFYVPVGHNYVGAPAQLTAIEVLEALKGLLEDPRVVKVGQNIKYDMSVLALYGIELKGIGYDTMLESYVLNSVGSRHDTEALAEKYLDQKTTRYESIAGKGAKQLTFNEIPVDQAAEFAAEQADLTLQLHQKLWSELAREKNLVSVFEDIELPLVAVLSRMERQGTLVDGGLLEAQSRQLDGRMRELIRQAWTLAGEEFNLDSTKQLQSILYEKLELPVLKKTPKGKPSTAEPVLQDLAVDFELPRTIIEYRSLAKLKSTYTDKLPLEINRKTGRIHTSYRQAVAATGRLSSSDPNLQNIPIRSEEGRRIRQAFVAPSGDKLVAADYSQIELRIMAHLSDDAGLLAAFAAGVDIHKATAAEVFGCSLDEVSSEQRRNAKAINFGLIYGMSAFGLGRQLHISRAVAQGYIDRYFERYPGVRTYMEATRAIAHDQGYVETVFGRRLYLPEINARHMQRRQAAERAAINAPMQGTAADVIKRAMLAVDAWLTESSINARMIMQVHDELVFEVAEDQVAELSTTVASLMEGAAELTVPLTVDVGVGDNWDEAH